MGNRTDEIMMRREEAIRNERVLAQLVELGDVPTIPREVDHYAFFSSRMARARFKWWAVRRSFSVISEETDREMERPYTIHLKRMQPVDPETNDEITFELASKAALLGGDYDGWGCEVTKG